MYPRALINLTYDNVGNLTDDGIFLYTLDGWNRTVKATRREDALTTVATYAFDGLGRLAARVFSHSGVEQVANDGGDTTVHNYYDARKPLETRNGSNQVTFQVVWGTQGQRELVLYEKNGDPTAANDTDPDVTATGEGSESPADQRWFVASDRAGKAVASTEYDPNGTNNGRVAERYIAEIQSTRTMILRGDFGNGELGLFTSYSLKGGIITSFSPFLRIGLNLPRRAFPSFDYVGRTSLIPVPASRTHLHGSSEFLAQLTPNPDSCCDSFVSYLVRGFCRGDKAECEAGLSQAAENDAKRRLCPGACSTCVCTPPCLPNCVCRAGGWETCGEAIELPMFSEDGQSEGDPPPGGYRECSGIIFASTSCEWGVQQSPSGPAPMGPPS